MNGTTWFDQRPTHRPIPEWVTDARATSALADMQLDQWVEKPTRQARIGRTMIGRSSIAFTNSATPPISGCWTSCNCGGRTKYRPACFIKRLFENSLGG